MEESKLQAIADSLAKHGGRKGLGTSNGDYSWSKTADSSCARTDGIPNNALYSNFVKEGTYDPTKKTALNHGDGRVIKRDFSDVPTIDDDGSTNIKSDKKSKGKSKASKEERKAAKKAAKLKAKKQAKLEEKRLLKKKAKMKKKGQESSAKAKDDL